MKLASSLSLVLALAAACGDSGGTTPDDGPTAGADGSDDTGEGGSDGGDDPLPVDGAQDLPAACGDSPDGTVEQRVRYAGSSAPVWVGCLAETQSRVCEDGTWSSWSGSFTAVTCMAEQFEDEGDGSPDLPGDGPGEDPGELPGDGPGEQPGDGSPGEGPGDGPGEQPGEGPGNPVPDGFLKSCVIRQGGTLILCNEYYRELFPQVTCESDASYARAWSDDVCPAGGSVVGSTDYVKVYRY